MSETGKSREMLIRRFDGVFGKVLGTLAKDLTETIHARGTFRVLEAGETVVREGGTCFGVPFVVSGSIRVFRMGETGREITLYRIGPGEACLFGTACGSAVQSFPAAMVAETLTTAAFLPSDLVESLMDQSTEFRRFVRDSFALRIAGVMELVEEVAFARVDRRLRDWLTEQCRKVPEETVEVTHQALAGHLGTSREVVSRILKDWEGRGLVQLGRNRIVLRPGLASLDLG